MDRRHFKATVKEGDIDQPCYVHFEVDEDIGIGMRTVVLRLRPGTDIHDAQELANMINAKAIGIRTGDLFWPSDPKLQ